MEQKKRNPDAQLITVILLALLFIAVLLFAILFSSKKGSDPKETKKETVSFPPITQGDDTVYDFTLSYSLASAYDSYEYDETELIFSSVSYPKLESGCGEHYESINSDIFAVASEYLTIKEHQKLLALEKYERSESSAEGFITNEFVFDCKSVSIKGRFLSVLFTLTKTVSISEPSVENITLLYDLATGQRADLSSLLGIGKADAVSYVKTIISQDIAINQEMYYVNALDDLEYVIDLSDVYLTNEGAIIFFNAEILTPSVYGVRTFLIPYDKIGY